VNERARLTREEAVRELRKLIGKDIRPLADKYGVTVFKNGKLNKGWAGHTLEKHLGFDLSSSQAPNGLNWELKAVPLEYNKRKGKIWPKETMAITMINAQDVAAKSFEQSHMWNKLRSLIICGRIFESKAEAHSKLYSVGTFDFTDADIIAKVKSDYRLVQNTIINDGFQKLTGKMGVYVQPRTKGPGHGSTSRAFYARKSFLAIILGLPADPS